MFCVKPNHGVVTKIQLYVNQNSTKKYMKRQPIRGPPKKQSLMTGLCEQDVLLIRD